MPNLVLNSAKCHPRQAFSCTRRWNPGAPTDIVKLIAKATGEPARVVRIDVPDVVWAERMLTPRQFVYDHRL
jgi:hypothetical protein